MEMERDGSVWEAREESFEINKKRMQIRHPCVLSFLQRVQCVDDLTGLRRVRPELGGGSKGCVPQSRCGCVVAQLLLTGHFRVFISTFTTQPSRSGLFALGAALLQASGPATGQAMLSTGLALCRSDHGGLRFQAFVCQGHASNMAHCVANGIRATENTRSRRTFPCNRWISASFSRSCTPLGQRHGEAGPQSSRALRSTSGTCCTHMSKVATMEGIADPSGDFNLAGTEQGWCFGFKCETGRDGTDSRVDVQDGQLFSWGNKPRGRKGQPSRNPIPSRQPQPRAVSA